MDNIQLINTRGHTLNVPSIDTISLAHSRRKLSSVPNTIILYAPLMSSISMKCSPDSVCDHSSLRMTSLTSLADWGIRKWRCLYS